MRILYKFPSRERPNKFFDAVRNIQANATNDDYLILGTFDINDSQMTTPEVKEALSSCPMLRSIYGTSNNKVHACNRDMEFSGDWDIVVLMSDDQKFLVKGFDTIIIQKMLEHFPDLDGVLHFPDSHGKHELSVLSIMGRKYYERFNYLYHPDYVTMFCDNEFTEVARILNKYAFVPMKIYDHFHHIWGMAAKDDLNVKNDDMMLYMQDNQTYLRRKANCYGINIFQ